MHQGIRMLSVVVVEQSAKALMSCQQPAMSPPGPLVSFVHPCRSQHIFVRSDGRSGDSLAYTCVGDPNHVLCASHAGASTSLCAAKAAAATAWPTHAWATQAMRLHATTATTCARWHTSTSQTKSIHAACAKHGLVLPAQGLLWPSWMHA